jgi:hypothetical protein
MLQTPQPDTDKGGQSGARGIAQKWLNSLAYLKLSEIAQFLRSRFTKAGQADGAASAAELSRPTLLDLANQTDALISREVREGCTNEIDFQLEEMRKALLEVGRSQPEADGHAVDRLWVNLLRLGLFDELRYMVMRLDLALRPEVSTLIHYCERQYEVCRQRGEAYRALHPAGDIFTMGCIVWGEEYVGNFLRYNVRSMLSSGNLPALRGQGRIVCSIVTDADSEQRIRQHPVFRELSDIADLEFTVIPAEVIGVLSKGHLVPNFYILYGMLDHCSIYYAEGANSHLFMIPVDAIVADGSLNNMANYRHEGYECCGGGNIVAETETFLPALDDRFGGDGPICISTEELATLAVEHAHHYFQSQVIALENVDFGKHPRELFWPVHGGVEIHSVFIHPLFTSTAGLAKYKRKHFANIDYGMIPRMFSDPSPIKIMEPRKAYVNNFTAAGRRYETTGRAFTVEDFLNCHDYTYPVQKGLFDRPQSLPCQLTGWTMYADVGHDVKTIAARFGVGDTLERSTGEPQKLEP